MDKLLSVKEAGEILGCCENKIRKMVLTQQLEGVIVGGRYRFTEAGLQKYIDDHTIRVKYTEDVSVPEIDEPEEPEDGVTVV